MDSGTTTTEIARALRNFRNLTIMTNAVNIAAELSGTALEVILTGGTLRKNSFSLEKAHAVVAKEIPPPFRLRNDKA